MWGNQVRSLDYIPFVLTIQQTFGDNFQSDGRLQGNPDVQTVNCNTGGNTCTVKVPAPSFALVFLTSSGLSAVSGNAQTYPTTAMTRTRNTVYIDPSVLAVSNGDYGFQNKIGTTSVGSSSDALPLRQALSGSIAIACIVAVMFAYLTHVPR
jgi:hypothetical protein